MRLSLKLTIVSKSSASAVEVVAELVKDSLNQLLYVSTNLNYYRNKA